MYVTNTLWYEVCGALFLICCLGGVGWASLHCAVNNDRKCTGEKEVKNSLASVSICFCLAWLFSFGVAYLHYVEEYWRYEKTLNNPNKPVFRGDLEDLSVAAKAWPKYRAFYFNNGDVDLGEVAHWSSGTPYPGYADPDTAAMAPVFVGEFNNTKKVAAWAVPLKVCHEAPCPAIPAEKCPIPAGGVKWGNSSLSVKGTRSYGSTGLCGFSHQWECFEQTENIVQKWEAQSAWHSEVIQRTYSADQSCIPVIVFQDPETVGTSASTFFGWFGFGFGTYAIAEIIALLCFLGYISWSRIANVCRGDPSKSLSRLDVRSSDKHPWQLSDVEVGHVQPSCWRFQPSQNTQRVAPLESCPQLGSTSLVEKREIFAAKREAGQETNHTTGGQSEAT